MAKSSTSMQYQTKELEILRNAVELAEYKIGKKQVSSSEVQEIIEIVELFLKRKKCLCYGGTAINNLLPEKDQFYNKDIELPDYDFFTPNALKDAIELADIYYSKGYKDVEAKAGQHFGTYKVFVNFLPVADITQLDPQLFKQVFKDAVNVNGIRYAPPNFLRMSMYLELSRPLGDVSRWEKVFKRLQLLNKHHPLKGEKCSQRLFIDTFENDNTYEPNQLDYSIYNIVKNTLISEGVVFFGGYAFSLYTRYINQKYKIPDFDVLSENPKKTANEVKKILEANGHKNVELKERSNIGEIVSPHIEVVVNKKPVVFIYEPSECNSYNILNIKGKTVKIATIDTMLAFYLAFLYGDASKYDKERILCMAEYLFKIQEQNKLKQYGILKRFSMKCYGKQSTKESIRSEKNLIYEELKDKKGTKQYDKYFLDYKPHKMFLEKNKNKKVQTSKHLKHLKRSTHSKIKHKRSKTIKTKP